MIILDTNVISEMMQPYGDASFDHWLRTAEQDEFYITSITYAEVLFGVARLPMGKRKEALKSLVYEILDKEFSKRILDFDKAAASIYADCLATLNAEGINVSVEDAMIAAIAMTHQATLASRNQKHFCHFEQFGLLLLNPWH